MKIIKSEFEIFWKHVGWHCISFGIHLDVKAPLIEIHFLSGFLRIGWKPTKLPEGYTWETGLFKIM